MNANINKTKKHLTIVFSAIVFVVIFVLWITFFITRYYKEIHIEKTEMISVFEGHNITVSFDKPTALQIDGETILGVTEYSVNTSNNE